MSVQSSPSAPSAVTVAACGGGGRLAVVALFLNNAGDTDIIYIGLEDGMISFYSSTVLSRLQLTLVQRHGYVGACACALLNAQSVRPQSNVSPVCHKGTLCWPIISLSPLGCKRSSETHLASSMAIDEPRNFWLEGTSEIK